MRVDDRVPADVQDLVALLYRADWTRLCMTAELTEFTDYRAYPRMQEAHRPPWVPRPGRHPGAGPGRTAAGRSRPAGDRDWLPGHRGRPADLDDDDEGADAEPYELPTARTETHRLLLAPGGRFRLETSASRGLTSVLVSDGRAALRVIGRERPVGRGHSERRDAAAFRIEIPAGTRVVQDAGSWLDEADVPAPVQTAMNLAGKAVSGAARVGSFLESLRQAARHGDQR